MSLLEIIEELKRHNVVPRVEGDQLKLSGDTDNLAEGFIEKIRVAKPALITWLRDAGSSASPIATVALQESYVASNAQQRLWLLSQLDGGSAAYNIVTGLYLKSEVDAAKMLNAVVAAVQRHESLRTVFREQNGQLMQVILSDVSFEPVFEDVSDTGNIKQYLEAEVKIAANWKFDLEQGLPLRVKLYKLAEGEYALLVVLHHIISDGWSVRVLLQEVLGQQLDLAPLKVQYKDYSSWFAERSKGEKWKDAKAFWTSQFASEAETLNLPFDFTRPEVKDFRGGISKFYFDAALYAGMNEFCRKHQLTLFNFLRSALTVVLNKFSGQDDITIGTPVSGRMHYDLENQVGLYVNTLPLRMQIESQESFLGFAKKVAMQSASAFEFQEYPFDKIVEDAGVKRDAGRNPLFDVLMALQDTAIGDGRKAFGRSEVEVMQLDNYLFESGVIERDGVASKFDLGFSFGSEPGNRFYVEVEYASSLFRKEKVRQLFDAVVLVMAQVLEQPQKNIGEIEIVGAAERRLILEGFNNTQVIYPTDKTLVNLFEEQVAKNPDKVALVFKDKQLTYNELNLQTNQLANYLRSNYNIQPDDLIAVQLERSEWMVISILAVLKAGGAYVPIDPEYPAERIEYMINDSQSKAVIDDAELQKFRNISNEYSHTNLLPANKPTDLTYVIYTSGSTGKPKGCMLEHRGVVNRMEWMWSHYGFNASDIILQKTTFTFDVSVWELFLPLCWGAKMVLCEREDIGSPERIVSLIQNDRITCLHFVPGMFSAFIANTELDERLSSLRLVITSGEALSPATVNAWYDKVNIPIHNLYGPTEASVDVTYYATSKGDKVIPIGKPIWNTQMHITGKSGELLPIGVAGEINIAGDGLARGYLNRPELTAEKFVANLFNPGTKMYRTGDLGRWLPDGNIEFLGRIDHQVKIRGYRIELGEIENALLELIDTAVVIARDGELIAYVSSNNNLREQLSKSLPSYMIPAHFVELLEFPLTSSGKIDRKKLPAPQAVVQDAYTAPTTEIQKQVVAVYEEVLKKHPISIKSDFFALGGDSIKSIQIVSRLKQAGFSLTIQDILLNPIIEELAKKVKLVTRTVDQGVIEGNIPLSPVQHLFFENHPTNNHHYNQSVLLTAKHPLVVDTLKDALNKLVRHHDALRMVFRQTESGWVQENKGIDHGYSFEEITVTDDAAFAQHCDRIQSTIDIQTGPLFKTALFHTSTGDQLLLVAHHLVIDGVSWRILFEDVSSLYLQRSIPAKTDSFKYWQEKQTEFASSTALQKEEKYWSAVEANVVESLPLDNANGTNLNKDAATSSFTLDERSTQKLLTQCHKAYETHINDILLTVLSLALKEQFNLNKALVKLEGHGRENISAETDVTRTIGWFTTMYPVVLNLQHSNDNIRQLIEVKETLHGVPNKGIGYGMLRYLAKKDYKLNPEIIFNYLGDIGSGNDLFEISTNYRGIELSPSLQRESLLDVSGIITNNQLRLSITYSNQQYNTSTIKALLASCQQYLLSLSTHLATETNSYLTPSDLGYTGLDADRLLELQKQHTIENVYPLSPLQTGLYFHWLNSPGSLLYFDQFSFRLKGKFQAELLEQSYRQLIARHAILRTFYTQALSDVLLQVVKKEGKPEFNFRDVRHEKDLSIEAFRQSDRSTGFNLHEASQMRLSVLQTDENIYEFVWSFHHIIMDGWCLSILLEEFFQFYYAGLKGLSLQPGHVYPYACYIQWLNEVDHEQSLSYWKNYLSGYDEVCSLPRKTVMQQGYESAEINFAISAGTRKKILEVCKKAGVTENTFFQAAWGILLGKYNNATDVVFGSVVSGRPAAIEGIEKMIGLFVNMIPVRVKFDNTLKFSDLLHELHSAGVEGMEYHYTQLAEVQMQSELKGLLFDHILMFQNYPVQELVRRSMEQKDNGADFSLENVSIFEQTNYDLVVTFVPGDELNIKFVYNAFAFDEALMNRVKDHFVGVVESVASDAAMREIDYLSEQEKRQLLSFNDTAVDYPKSSIAELFIEQAAKTPNKVALVFEDKQLTYRELDLQTNQLANYLLSTYEIKPDTLIGIMLERSDKLIIAILAILKAGAAYVPIDPAYPAARKQYILEDTGVQVLLTQTDYIFDLDYFNGAVFAMDVQLDTLDNATTAPIVNIKLTDLAYVMYTSGSMGKPKGVMVEQQGVVRLVKSSNYVVFTGEETLLSTGAVSFDATTFEYWGMLLNGGKLVLCSKEVLLDEALLAEQIKQHEVGIMWFTAGWLNQLVEKDINVFSGLKTIVAGGDKLSAYHINQIRRTFPGVRVVNGYGPTENTTFSLCYEIKEELDNIPVGSPISNSTAFIIDVNQQLCGVGVVGEICVGGDGLARGYLNNDELTKEKFVNYSGQRIYKTGDLGRWLPDGNIEFLGRKDDQVKIRGFRIELGEIENALLSHEDVSAAVVIMRNTELVAYVVSKDVELRSYLSKLLPSYMLPAYYVRLEQLPLNSNGKVDKKSLPDPDGIETGITYVAPRTKTEERLAKIWKDILNRDVSVTDNFFEVGGHSLKATRLASQIHKEFEIKIELKDIFSKVTLEDQANFIDQSKKTTFTAIQPLPEQPDYELSSSQRRLYVLSQVEAVNLTYNIPIAYIFEGDLGITALECAFHALINRHEILRTTFRENAQGQVRQFIAKPGDIQFTIGRHDLRNTPNQQLADELVQQEFEKTFDLSNGPLFRANLYQLEDNKWLFTYVMHHIISDGWSLGILTKELLHFYHTYTTGTEHALSPLRIQYKDYAAWQQQHMCGEAFEAHKNYWLQQFAGNLPTLNLKGDKTRPAVKTHQGSVVTKQIDASLTNGLRSLSQQQGGTLFMGLLAATNVLLHRYTRDEDIVIGTPIANREHADLEGQIGFYLNTLALRTRFKSNDSFTQLLTNVKQVTLDAYAHQEYPFDELVDALQLKRDMSRNALFDVMILLQNFNTNTSIGFEQNLGDVSVKAYGSAQHVVSKYDLTFYFTEVGNEINTVIEYNSDIFNKDTVERMGDYLERLLKAIIQQPSAPVNELIVAGMNNAGSIQLQHNDLLQADCSEHQKRLWFIDQFERNYLYEGSPVYHNLPLIVKLPARTDLQLLQSSIQHVVSRHSALQTQLLTQNSAPFQVLNSAAFAGCRYHTFGNIYNVQELIEQCLEIIESPFDIHNDPLVRFDVITYNADQQLLIITAHHLVADRRSLSIVMNEIGQHYNGSKVDTSFQYMDFSEWQNDLTASELEASIFYWKRKLENAPVLYLDTDREREYVHVYEADHVTQWLHADTTSTLERFCEQRGLSPYMFFLATFQALLHRYTGSEEIVTGALYDNRDEADVTNIVGPLASLLTLKTGIDGNISFEELLREVTADFKESVKHWALSFEKIVLELNPGKDMSRTALFDVMMHYEEQPLQFEQLELNRGLGKYDLNLLVKKDNGFACHLTFNQKYFDRSRIERFVGYYISMIDHVLADPAIALGKIDFVSTAEKQQIIHGFNDTNVGYPEQATIVTLFEEQARQTPENIAVVFEDRSLTYKQLNERSNQLAAYLRKHYDLERQDLVSINMEKSECMIVAIMAVLKAGCAYVPIDPAYPQDRIAYMINDSQCKLVIDEAELELFRAESRKYSTKNLKHITKPTDLAYVIYTSGTTGKPKGSLIEHRNVVRLMKTDKPLFDFRPTDVWTMFHSHCFDFSVWEMYGALLFGGKVVVIPSMVAKDTAAFLGEMNQHGVTVLNQTPSAFYNLIKEELEKPDATLNFRYVIFGGEALSPGKLKAWHEKYPQTQLINMYGITETTVHVTYKEITEKEIELNSSNIGRPIPTLSCYVLDQYQQLLPIGVSGELYVGGDGVGRGYLNREELTSVKFIESPFKKGERLYRSGDKVRMLENGELEYAGRIDDQVKIRGYRIELGEIENALQMHADIDAAVVIAREGDLIAYVVSETSVTGLRLFLSEQLPSYMIPSYFVQLDKLPLTSNGKVDKKNLPAPGKETNSSFVAPATKTEEKLAKIWAEILNKKIGASDNFFEVGGHSLKATRLVSLIYQEFEVKLELKNIFITPVLRDQAALIDESKKTLFVGIAPVAEQENYALSSSQRRLYVLSQFEEASVAYNMPGVFVFEGKLDQKALERAFDHLIARHESLRTTFRTNDEGEVRQFIHSDIGFTIERYDLSDEPARLKQLVDSACTMPFDLATGPLLRASLYQVENNKWVFCYVMHHIVSDGWSMGVLIKELLALYNGAVLSPLRIQYKDFAAWQHEQMHLIEEHKQYWLKQFEGELPVLALQGDKPRPANKTFAGNVISKKLNNKIKGLTQQNGATLFMGLLAAVKLLLNKYTGQEDIIIGSPIAGRQHADLEGQIGFYLNTLALRTQFSDANNFNELLAKVKQTTLDAYEHQVYPFDVLVDELKLQRDMSRHPLFDVMVILQNNEQVSAVGELGELKVSAYAEQQHVISKFDLLFDFMEQGDELQLNLEYNTDIYSKSTVERMALHLESILHIVTQEPITALNKLDYVSEAEKLQIQSFNDTAHVYPTDKTLVNLFEEQVAKNPDKIALVFKDKHLTYHELHLQTNQLANYLRTNHNIQPDDLIAVQLERSEWMVISILAVLKAGGAYVPIDPEYPAERIEYMINDSQCKAVIDDAELQKFRNVSNEYSHTNLKPANKPTDLAYVIYTSGSTGKPKGCMLEHRGVVNRIEWMWSHYGFNASDIILQKTTFTFDVSVWELFLPLCWGAKMVLCEREDIGSPERIVSLIENEKVTCLHFVPAMFSSFIANTELDERLSSLRRVITSGEALSPATVNAWYDKVNIPIHNLYGPTEASVDVTYYPTSKGDKVIPIGKPIWNTQMHITGKSGEILPIGVAGEINIAGDGLARGYLNRPELTAEKFVTNPFNPGTKMYRTGDLGRWLPDGNIEFLGRIDHQVKIRGYRIELGEIENVLLELIDTAVVIAKDGELIAYVSSNKNLREELLKSLPSYMIPAHFVELHEFPLTSSGKIDRKKLPAPQNIVSREYVAPRNETEEKLASIWQDILGKEKIGIKDNFFDLGGHSLKAIALSTQVQKQFGVKVNVRDVFMNPTIETTANIIRAENWIHNSKTTRKENRNIVEV